MGSGHTGSISYDLQATPDLANQATPEIPVPTAVNPVEPPQIGDVVVQSGDTTMADYSASSSDQVQEVAHTYDVATTTQVDVNSADGIAMTLAGQEPHDAQVDATGTLMFKTAGNGVSTGYGFLPGSTVHLYIHSTPRLLATGIVDENGNFSVPFLVPGDLQIGPHDIQAQGIGRNDRKYRSLVAAVKVAPENEYLLSSGGVGGWRWGLGSAHTAANLAYTGSNLNGLLASGLALLAAGMGALGVQLRRRRFRTRRLS